MRFANSLKLLAMVVAAACFWPTLTLAWPGKAQRIVDGDTISVTDSEGIKHRIRLYGVDCPEKGQPEGEQALQAAIRFTKGCPLEIQELRRDRNGRVIAVVVMSDGMTIQELLLVYGLAWIDERYCHRPECEAWRLLEQAARLSKRGIWSTPDPIAPWNWRRGAR